MLVNTEAIILSYINYSESSIILKIYTKDYGLKSFIIKGIRTKRKSSITLGQLQPLTIIELTFNEKKSAKLSYINSIKLLYPFKSINSKIMKINISLFISEFLTNVLISDLSNKNLFDFLTNSLKWYDNSENYMNFHILLMIHFLKFLGINPVSTEDKFMYFDIENGIFSNKLISNNYVSGEVVYDLNSILGTNFDYNNEVLKTNKQRKNMLDFLISYYSFHVAGFRPLKSIKILHEIFS